MLQASDVGRSETLIVGIKMTILLVLIVLVRIIPHPAVRRSVEWFPAE